MPACDMLAAAEPSQPLKQGAALQEVGESPPPGTP